MDCAQAAKMLDGSTYGNEGSKAFFAEMKAAGLVAVFGASDDLMEMRGAVDDEIGCWQGGEAFFTSEGLLTNECDDADCPHFGREKRRAAIVEAVWCDGPSWTYKTTIPHETFTVMEDDEVYCRGIVFDLSVLKALEAASTGEAA